MFKNYVARRLRLGCNRAPYTPLLPLILHVKSYFRDNIDSLELCSRVKNADTILVTFEVISLCTIILHAHEVEALSCWIDKHPGSLHERFN